MRKNYLLKVFNCFGVVQNYLYLVLLMILVWERLVDVDVRVQEDLRVRSSHCVRLVPISECGQPLAKIPPIEEFHGR